MTAPSPSLTPAQKRAASYANTINTLFIEILDSRQSADRVLANYFRSNKKHGSKDRRVIRETLFALFRWWGWLQQLENGDEQSLWFQRLALAAAIEAHPWTDIVCAWQQQAGKSFALPEQLWPPKPPPHWYPRSLADMSWQETWRRTGSGRPWRRCQRPGKSC